MIKRCKYILNNLYIYYFIKNIQDKKNLNNYLLILFILGISILLLS